MYIYSFCFTALKHFFSQNFLSRHFSSQFNTFLTLLMNDESWMDSFLPRPFSRIYKNSVNFSNLEISMDTTKKKKNTAVIREIPAFFYIYYILFSFTLWDNSFYVCEIYKYIHYNYNFREKKINKKNYIIIFSATIFVCTEWMLNVECCMEIQN